MHRKPSLKTQRKLYIMCVYFDCSLHAESVSLKNRTGRKSGGVIDFEFRCPFSAGTRVFVVENYNTLSMCTGQGKYLFPAWFPAAWGNSAASLGLS
jgi:hypothetical protein